MDELLGENGEGGSSGEEKPWMGESEEEGEGEDWDDDPPPPPPQEEKELLFLLEFLVNTLHVRQDALTDSHLDPCVLKGQNCVTLSFLHFPPMTICQKDVDSEKNAGENEAVFNAGKSLVFALTEGQFEEPPPVILAVSAHKEMPHAFDIQRLELGKTDIDLSELFKIVFQKYDEKPNELPLAKSLKDSFVLEENGKALADMEVYIRLTCMGQNIVTEFQKSDDICDPFLFKNLESEKVYECRETVGRGDAETSKFTRSQERRKKPDPEDENYEEIYAEINGCALTIAVEKNKRREPPKPFRLEDFCDCDVSLPPDLIEGLSEISISPVVTGQLEIPDGGVGKRNNKLIFQVPPSGKLAQPDGLNSVFYNVNTCKEGEAHGHKGKNSFKVVTDNDVNQPKMPNDPEKDVFVLRIIKRGRSSQKGKGNLELELRTPKEKIVPPPKPPYMIERSVGPEKQEKKKKK